MDAYTTQLLRDAPVIPPPSGVDSNFEDPESLGLAIKIVNGVFLPLMLLVVSIRLYTRAFILCAIGWDDCKFH